MDNREDHPRVSVGTVQDWQKLKSYYREAFVQAITRIASTQGLARGQNIALAHMEQVHFYLLSLSDTELIQWVERTFNYAQPNLRINGNAFESLDESARGTKLQIIFSVRTNIELRNGTLRRSSRQADLVSGRHPVAMA